MKIQIRFFCAVWFLIAVLVCHGGTIDLGLQTGPAIEARFQSQSGRLYVIEESPEIEPLSWKSSTQPFYGNGQIIKKALISSDATKRFYRVVEYDLSAGLAAYFPFSGNANDASGNGNHGVLGNVTLTEDRFGRQDSAYSFDGSGEITIGNQMLLNNATQATICGWIVMGDTSGTRRDVVAAGDNRPGLDPYEVGVQSGEMKFAYFADANLGSSHPQRMVGAEGVGGVKLQSGTWTFFTQVFESTANSSEHRLYLNGLLVRKVQYGYPIKIGFDTSMPIKIGSLNGFNKWVGKIDDLRFYSRALAVDEISALYQEEAYPRPVAVLTAKYDLDGNGSDSSGNGLNATVSGWGFAADRFGNPNGSLLCTGSGSAQSSALKLNNTENTISFWMRLDSLPRNFGERVLEHGNYDTAASQFSVAVWENLDIAFSVINTGGSGVEIKLANRLELQKWHHIAASYGGGVLKLFIDGQYSGQVTTTLRDINAVLSIGSFGDYIFRCGRIDDLRIYNQKLTDTEIRAVFDGGL